MTPLAPSRYTNTANSVRPDIVYDVSRTILSRLSLSDALLARRISPVWKADVDSLMEEAWKAARKGAGSLISSQSLAGMIAQVTKEAFNACSLEHLEHCPLGQEVSACELFGRLSRLFKKTYGIELDLTKSLDSLAEQIHKLQMRQQQIHDKDLCAIWPHIYAQLSSTATSALPPPATANAVRAWMMDPANVSHLAGITYLYIDNCHLNTIPSEVGKLFNLSSLFCRGNQITNIPAEIGQLPILSSLDLCNNQITHIPEQIGQLSHLRWLSLSNNQITRIPDEIGQLAHLGWFHFANNPILCIAKAVVASVPTRNNITVQNFSKALQWDAKSSMAKLCLAIMQDSEKAMKQMPALLSNLSSKERTCIFFHVENLNKRPQTECAQWGKQHALDDPEIFMRAVHQSIMECLNSLTEEQKNAVYEQVYQWAAERPMVNIREKELLALSNLPCLADALSCLD